MGRLWTQLTSVDRQGLADLEKLFLPHNPLAQRDYLEASRTYPHCEQGMGLSIKGRHTGQSQEDLKFLGG